MLEQTNICKNGMPFYRRRANWCVCSANKAGIPATSPRIFRDRTNPLAFSNEYLWERYRFTRPSIVYLSCLLEPQIRKSTQRSQALTTMQSVCVTLRFLASGTFPYTVGDAEGLSKATICREIRRVCLALKKLLNVFITFPCHLPPEDEGSILFNCRNVMIKLIYDKVVMSCWNTSAE